jgi:hypothetical protein
VQPAKAALSSAHSNVTGVSSALKVTVADVLVVWPDGADVICTFGGVVSGGEYVQLSVTHALEFPALSVPSTENRCSPAARPVSTTGLVQAATPDPSVEHLNETPRSLAVNAIFAESVEATPEGPPVNVIFGATVSAGGAGGGEDAGGELRAGAPAW